MEFKTVTALKVNNMYFEIGDTICFTLADSTEWKGILETFGDMSMRVDINGTKRWIELIKIERIWK